MYQEIFRDLYLQIHVKFKSRDSWAQSMLSSSAIIIKSKSFVANKSYCRKAVSSVNGTPFWSWSAGFGADKDVSEPSTGGARTRSRILRIASRPLLATISLPSKSRHFSKWDAKIVRFCMISDRGRIWFCWCRDCRRSSRARTPAQERPI